MIFRNDSNDALPAIAGPGKREREREQSPSADNMKNIDPYYLHTNQQRVYDIFQFDGITLANKQAFAIAFDNPEVLASLGAIEDDGKLVDSQVPVAQHAHAVLQQFMQDHETELQDHDGLLSDESFNSASDATRFVVCLYLDPKNLPEMQARAPSTKSSGARAGHDATLEVTKDFAVLVKSCFRTVAAKTVERLRDAKSPEKRRPEPPDETSRSGSGSTFEKTPSWMLDLAAELKTMPTLEEKRAHLGKTDVRDGHDADMLISNLRSKIERMKATEENKIAAGIAAAEARANEADRKYIGLDAELWQVTKLVGMERRLSEKNAQLQEQVEQVKQERDALQDQLDCANADLARVNTEMLEAGRTRRKATNREGVSNAALDLAIKSKTAMEQRMFDEYTRATRRQASGTPDSVNLARLMQAFLASMPPQKAEIIDALAAHPDRILEGAMHDRFLGRIGEDSTQMTTIEFGVLVNKYANFDRTTMMWKMKPGVNGGPTSAH